MFRRFLTFIAITALLAVLSAFCYARSKAEAQTDPEIQKQAQKFNSLIDSFTYANSDSALYYARKSLEFAKKVSFEKGEADAYLKLGKIFYVKGVYDESLAFALSGLKQSQEVKYKTGIANAYNNIGLIYLAQDKMDDAVRELLKSLKISLEINDEKLLARNYFNLGLAYDEKNNAPEAIKYLNKALEVCRETGNTHMEAMAYNRMGETYFRIKDYARALTFYKKVAGSNKKINDWELSFAHSGIAQAQYGQGRYSDAISSASKALELAMNLKAKWDIERSLKILYESFEAVNDYKNAFKYLKLDKIYSDSLYNEAKDNEINKLHLQRKQLENAQLARENELHQQQLKEKQEVILIITALAIFLLILTGLVWWLYRQKSQLNKDLARQAEIISSHNTVITLQNQELENVNHAKDQLFSVIGHDLRSPFASILQAMTLLKEGDLSTEEMKYFLDGFFEKLTVTASMLDNLVLWAQSQRQGIKSVAQNLDVTDLNRQLLAVSEFLIQEKDLKIKHDGKDDHSVYCDPDHARIILHNILGNAIKFTPHGGQIEIFYTSDQDRLSVHIKDSGLGMSEEKIGQLFNLSGKDISSYGTNNERGIGIGLMLVKRFAQENDAEIEVKSAGGQGTEFIVKFLNPQD